MRQLSKHKPHVYEPRPESSIHYIILMCKGHVWCLTLLTKIFACEKQCSDGSPTSSSSCLIILTSATGKAMAKLKSESTSTRSANWVMSLRITVNRVMWTLLYVSLWTLDTTHLLTSCTCVWGYAELCYPGAADINGIVGLSPPNLLEKKTSKKDSLMASRSVLFADNKWPEADIDYPVDLWTTAPPTGLKKIKDRLRLGWFTSSPRCRFITHQKGLLSHSTTRIWVRRQVHTFYHHHCF